MLVNVKVTGGLKKCYFLVLSLYSWLNALIVMRFGLKRLLNDIIMYNMLQVCRFLSQRAGGERKETYS